MVQKAGIYPVNIQTKTMRDINKSMGDFYMQKHRRDLLSGFYGRFFTGFFTKLDGTERPVWGVIKNDPNVPDHLCVVYDMRLKQYRRFNIELPFNIRSGKDFICAAHTNA